MSLLPKVVGYSALAMLLALYVVGIVSHGVVRHIVQTLPLWFSILHGLRRHEIAKWTSIPCFVIWLILMVLIWLYLLGWAKVISGHFTPIEVVLTVVVATASVAGLVAGIRWKTKLSWGIALFSAVISAVLQVIAFRISLLPAIAKDQF